MATTTIRALLNAGEFIAAPGIFDLLSAKIADRTDAKALYMTGFGAVASCLRFPDVGPVTHTDVLNRASAISRVVTKPLIAEADTTYGGLLNVHHTVQSYERAGVAMILLEDQLIPHRCSHTLPRHIVPLKQMVSRIKVASDARSSRDFLILARTDARATEGLDEALRRSEAYALAGADAICIEAPESVEEMRKIGSLLDVPVVSNQLHGGRTPSLTQAQLREIGFSVAIYPTTGLFAAAKALAGVYASHISSSEVTAAPFYGFQDFLEMIGFQDVRDLESRFADVLEFERGARM